MFGIVCRIFDVLWCVFSSVFVIFRFGLGRLKVMRFDVFFFLVSIVVMFGLLIVYM